jgi:cytochrome b subunit of formate dehydrogenase
MVLTLAIFSCSITGIVLLLNSNTDESYPYFNNSFTIFYNCLLIDFFAFQVLKVLIQMWILSGTTSSLMRSKRIRSLTRSLVERYFLRYYSIFWIKERKSMQALGPQ